MYKNTRTAFITLCACEAFVYEVTRTTDDVASGHYSGNYVYSLIEPLWELIM